MSYDTVFSRRASSYLRAVNEYPHVMTYENQTIVTALELKEGDRLLHVACAGVYIEPYFGVSCEYVRIEQNKVMAELDNAIYCPLYPLPYPTESFDKIVIAATLHHYTEEERMGFYTEVTRLLKPGGKFVLCDVLKGSEQDALLNVCVDMYNPGGHKGCFFTPEYKELLKIHFSDVTTSIYDYPWLFTSIDELNEYCNGLFYLKRLDVKDTMMTMSKYITINTVDASDIRMNWRLIYFVCTK